MLPVRALNGTATIKLPTFVSTCARCIERGNARGLRTLSSGVYTFVKAEALHRAPRIIFFVVLLTVVTTFIVASGALGGVELTLPCFAIILLRASFDVEVVVISKRRALRGGSK
jgi:F0F1-type ATP synthase assembly protein I